MITFSQYENFFEDIAKKYKPISHSDTKARFATMDIDDILSAQRGTLDFVDPCMILENFEGELEWKHDRVLDETYGAFYILQHIPRNDPEKKRTIMTNTKTHAVKIVSKLQKMKIDFHKGVPNIPKMILYFDFSQVKYQKVSNVFAGCHGWRFEFNLGQEDLLSKTYDPDDWHQEEEGG
ncbi:hypothetical protein [Mongoliibacter ruber]|uniref:Uncharacterized protein n=1 Tax=Mongoliibacter ruber TaxID=1750599 RepID=A0A2T0WV47_9BACT|nr:hypothetical protein [Mongoliibacter ruber]PRY90565.1 hypothetical protein CLW00_101228 [Mongoliibacter ruber]